VAAASRRIIRSITEAIPTELTLPGIRVETGGVQVGVYSEGNDGEWLGLDDVSLVRD
jgi:hypothetical protein